MRKNQFENKSTANTEERKGLLQDVTIDNSKKHRSLTTKERLEGYAGDYKATEWDTGPTVGREIF